MNDKDEIKGMNLRVLAVIGSLIVLVAGLLFIGVFDSSEQVWVENPNNETIIEGHSVNIGFGFDFDEAFEYSVYLNGEEVESLRLLADQGNERSLAVSGLTPKTHTLEVVARPESGRRESSGIYVFETTEEPLLAVKYITSYASTVEFEYSLFRDAEMSLNLDEEEVWSSERGEGFHTDYIRLENYQGEYEAELVARSGGLEVSETAIVELN